MMKKFITACNFLFVAICAMPFMAAAQYAPQAGVTGSTAIAASSSQFVAWATHCDVQRGWMDIADQSLGKVSAGDSSVAIGAPDGFIVSLGDSGIATLTFAQPIVNGPGYDFAVFENGFANPANAEEAYLELAFVEVSSDGINYFRFPATSMTPDTAQIAGVGTYMNARFINNLAGKYIGNYGTPFDLSELAGNANLDLNHITHIRLVDVVGSIGAHASYDDGGRKINDPYPTAFPTGGFDLDGVGVINQSATSVANVNGADGLHIYPNPATDKIWLQQDKNMGTLNARLTDVSGKTVMQQTLSGTQTAITITALAKGMYYLILQDANGHQWVEKITKL